MTTETMDSSTQTYDDPQLGSGLDGFTCPRVQIDTSAPFGSVEEAVIRFGGRGFWIPRRLLPSDESEEEEVDIYKIEEALDTKQQQTLNILKELDLTKRLIDQLKLKLHKESTNCSNLFPLSSAGSVILELKQAKQNLYQSTNDLEAIRASIEHVHKKVEKKKKSLGATNEAEMRGGNTSPLGVLRELNYEAEQFMKTAEAAKAEVLKAMFEIEQTKTGLKMIEMRWVAAKKLEEAAKALAEIKALSTNDATTLQQKAGRVSLSFEEYASLAEKARKAENIEAQRPTTTTTTTTTSIGDILSRKMVLRDDLDRGEGQRVSLNQMLDRHRTSTPPRRRAEESDVGASGGDSKGFFWKRKALGFVHVSLPLSRQSKNRIQALNLWSM